MTTWMAKPFTDLYALTLGALLVLAFAPFGIFPFAVLAPAGLLALLLNQSPKRCFWLGFLFGIGYFGFGVYWVYISIHDVGGVPAAGAFALTAALASFLALYTAIASYLMAEYFAFNQWVPTLLGFPALWVIMEWLRSWILTGFPWLLIGYSQTISPLNGFAPILGVYGVSLAVLLTSGMLVYAILCYQQQKFKAVYYNLLGITALWTLGGLLSLLAWTSPQDHSIKVSLIQGNIPQTLKWSPEHLDLSLRRYEELTTPLLKKGNIVIWPEAAVPLPLDDAESYINALDAKAEANDAHVLVGVPIKSIDGNGYYNAMVTLGSGKKQVYLKRRLVPFGEYVPFSRWISGVFDFMQIPMSNLVPGDWQQPMLTIDDVNIFVSICYEIAYPEMTKIRNPTLGLILTVTNDAWFGDSPAQAQHLQMAAMRAAELRRPVLFVTNDGITAVIKPNGQIAETIPAREVGILNTSVQPMLGTTPWMTFGMDPILAILLAMIIGAKIRIRRNAPNTVEQTHTKQEGF